MKNKRSLWISLLSVVAIAVIALSATLAAGWSPKLGLDLDGGLSVVYQTHRPVTSAQLSTIVTIINDRVNAGTTGATVDSQGKNQISVSIPGEKNTQQVLATLGNTAQLYFRPAECYAPAFTVAKGKAPSVGAFPTCAAGTQLTKANLNVTPDSSNVNGYTYNTNIQPDPQFTTYRSTPSTNDNKNDTVLLPGSAANGCYRALRPRAGRHDRHRGQVGQRPAQQRPVGRQPQSHQHRRQPVGRPRQSAVPRHHRDRPRRPGHLGADHPAHPGIASPPSTARCRSPGASPRTRPRRWPPTSPTAPSR